MSASRYLSSDGRQLRRHEFNNHHCFFNAKWYRPGEEQRFRNMGGLVLPMLKSAHDDLHANIQPPPKPSKQLREQIAEFTCGTYEADEYAQFYRIAHFIGDVANSSWSPERADEAFHIHENLMEQSEYIEIGRVTELRAVA